MVRTVLAILFFSLLHLLAEDSKRIELPVELFFRNAELWHPRLAPDGKHLAAITSDHGTRQLLAVNLATGERAPIMIAEAFWFTWANNERLIFMSGGLGFGGLFAINRDGSQMKMLAPPPLYQSKSSRAIFSFLSVPADAPDSVLVERAELPSFRPRLLRPEVRRMNIFTGKSTLEEKNPGNVVSWITDSRGNVWAAIAVTDKAIQTLYRRQRQGPWTVISETKLSENPMLPLISGPETNEIIVAAHNGQNTTGVYRFDVQQKRFGECLWRDEHFDFAGALSRAKQLSGIIYESDRLQVHWLDQRYKGLKQQVDNAFQETINLPISESGDGTKIIYQTFSDRAPGSYYLFDVTRQQFKHIGSAAPWIKPEQMASMRPIEYRSRDDLKIHGYLTIPRGSVGKNLPLIAMPHGGPWIRDSWEFEPQVQFFANRGYAVLQMNFRGSTGFGSSFQQAGFRQWGRKMQDDITDGVNWAIEQGIADRNRVAIYGASYGGYAALMGLITTPELYKCAISYAGVTDIKSFLRSNVARRPKQSELLTKENVGDYRADKEELKAVSPLNHVDKIRAPVLLAYGGHDRIVNVDQGRDLAKQLQKQGKKYELIIEKQEGHGFQSETNQVKLFRRIEAFLKENL